MALVSAQGWIIYQPLIVGLGAVVLATFGNTILEWFRQSLSQRHQSKTLRRALAEELRHAKDTAETNRIRAKEPIEDGEFIIPLQETYRVYDHNIGSLGLLRSDEIAAVINAYAMLHAQVEVLSVMGHLQRIEGAVLHAVVSARWANVLAGQADGLIEALSDAVTALDR